MRFSVYCLAFYFKLNNHKTDTQNKISIEETVTTWFTFKPALELTGFQATQLCFQQFYLKWAHDPIETSIWSAVNLNKTHDVDKL